MRGLDRIAVIGRGRLGTALVPALRAAGPPTVDGPLGRGADPRHADVVLLCVPDAQIAAAEAALSRGPLDGAGAPDVFRGAGAGVAGSTPRALAAERELVA